MPPIQLFTKSTFVLTIASVIVGFVVLLIWLISGTVSETVGYCAAAIPAMAIYSAIYLWMNDLYEKKDSISSVLAWINTVGIVTGWSGIILYCLTQDQRWAVATIFAGLVAGISFVLRENFG